MSPKRWIVVSSIIAAVVWFVRGRVKKHETDESFGVEPVVQTPAAAA
jgi:hypothetical protein